MSAAAVLASPRDREFEFSDRDFERVRRMIHERAGIALSPLKQDMVYSRLGRRLRQLNLSSFDAYLSRLERGDDSEWQEFTNALTTNLTSFFREAHHFPLLAEHLRRVRGRGEIRLWCSAASTGEEPYSMAMTVVETLGTGAQVRVLATDVDTQVLDKASAGIYPAERVERLDPSRVQRFFARGTGANAGFVRVKDELRDMVRFRPLNLLHERWPIRGPLDAIFCRNVMIYFDKPTQLAVLEKFTPLLRADGLMFAGHSESFHHAQHLFRLRGKTVYELAATAKANS